MESVIVVKESFSITQRGFFVELQHYLPGLPSQTVLSSLTTGRKWEVVSRVVFAHMVEEHVWFEVEQVNPIRLSFSDSERLSESRLATLAREQNHIYEYQLKGVGHLEKPSVGERLQIVHS